ncbi:uncharacterized protein [Clytia hemisphaerica]
MLWHRKDHNKHFDIEKICEDVYPTLKKVIDQKWFSHECNETGCKNKMVVIDGNEKLYRYCCAKPITKLPHEIGEVNKVVRCINNPVRGNQSLKGSKLCHIHSNESGEMKNEIKNERLDLYPMTRQRVKLLENVITSGEGCKKEENCNKYETRTAGMLYVFRSCGIRLSHFEMYTAESLSMVFTGLIDIFQGNLNGNLKGIVYDRSCDLHPYVCRLAREGNVFAKEIEELMFIVDVFHAEKHTQSKCVLSSDDCKYHPDLPKFKDVRKMNTEVCEQTFHVLNCYKNITRNMTYAKRLCLLKLLDDNYNTRLSKKLSY